MSTSALDGRANGAVRVGVVGGDVLGSGITAEHLVGSSWNNGRRGIVLGH